MRLFLTIAFGPAAVLFASGAIAGVVYSTYPSNYHDALIPSGVSIFFLGFLMALSAVCMGAALWTVWSPGAGLATGLLAVEPLIVVLPFVVLLANSSIVFSGVWDHEVAHDTADLAARLAVAGGAFSGLGLLFTIVYAIGRRL